MGVIQTGNIFKGFTFDGVNSKDYGVYITGEAVFNAPERAVEMVSIAGRNGAYALDKGHFENIEVTYPAGIFAENETDFANAVSDFRNFLCSKVGYVRLQDEYNPDEYRLAIYKSGLEVDHEGLISGEFDITFNCKPQRYLTSGEETIHNPNVLTNPTLFASSPMLEVTGYGDIHLGDNDITINNGDMGDVIVFNETTYNNTTTQTIDFDDTYANSGDTITVAKISLFEHSVWDGGTMSSFSTSASGTATIEGTLNSKTTEVTMADTNIVFTHGTSATHTSTAQYSFVDGTYGTVTETITLTLVYDGVHTLTFSTARTHSPNPPTAKSNGVKPYRTLGPVTIYSTKPSLGNPLYIDLDIGEAYKIEGGSAVSVNNGVELPAELPTLPSGNTTVTYDNTITNLDIVPRWWKV